MDINTVTLIGLGAMGSFFAPRLHAALGDNFRVLANGERGERLRRNGISVDGVRYHFPVIDSSSAGPSDLIIIAVKSYALAQAIEDIRPQVGERTQILCVLNGISSEEQVAAAYGWERVLYSFMRVSVVMKDGASNYSGGGAVHFGEAGNTVRSERVQAVAALFDRAGIPYEVDEDMITAQWFKFMANVGENMTCALLGIPFGAFRTSDGANYIRIAAMEEVRAIANAKGIPLTEEHIRRQNETILGIKPENKPSTLQDLEAGKHTEVELFAGTVVRLGRALGIPTPVNEVLYHGIQVLEEKPEAAWNG